VCVCARARACVRACVCGWPVAGDPVFVPCQRVVACHSAYRPSLFLYHPMTSEAAICILFDSFPDFASTPSYQWAAWGKVGEGGKGGGANRRGCDASTMTTLTLGPGVGNHHRPVLRRFHQAVFHPLPCPRRTGHGVCMCVCMQSALLASLTMSTVRGPRCPENPHANMASPPPPPSSFRQVGILLSSAAKQEHRNGAHERRLTAAGLCTLPFIMAPYFELPSS
jgi:hypothetical protein